MTPNSNSAEIFVQCTYPEVLSTCVYSFGCYRVDKRTRRSNVFRYATTLGNEINNDLDLPITIEKCPGLSYHIEVYSHQLLVSI